MKDNFKKAIYMRSIQWRLMVILVLITLVLMSVVWVFLNMKVESIFYNDFKKDIETHYDALEINELNMDYKTLVNTLQTNPLIAGVIFGEDKSYTIIDKSNNEICYSSDLLSQQDKIQFRNEIFKSKNLLAVLSSENDTYSGKQSYTHSKHGDFYDYVKTQLLKDGEYILVFKYSRQRALDVLDEFNEVIFLGLIFAITAAIFIGYLLSRTITKPINDIMHKAEKISDGEFGYALEVKSDDELGKLARTFNFMSSRLKSTLTEITSEKKKIETILNYMTDGIIAFNHNGQLIHINPTTHKILNKEINEDSSLNDITQILGIKLSIEQINREQLINDGLHKLQFHDKYLRVQLAAFTNENAIIDGIIVVIQDITEEQKLEKMRREFVANVSHELRTPLTSVKSYTETLLDGALQDPATAEHFLGVINDETDRMTMLVKDLLTLSQHDGGITLNIEDISITDLTNSCVERLRREANVKHQEIKLNVKQNMPIIKGDRHRIDQILINIIGNAIKYTQEKGRILVSIYCERNYAVICVEDNGMGIPDNDIGRIFERFYRVDKARSRQMGGTGLGLAIAKEIALLHGGNITAKSKLGRGTSIYIELPIKQEARLT